MSRSPSHVACTLLILLAMATLVTPGAWAAPLQEVRRVDSPNLFVLLWETISSIWTPADPAPTPDEGCGIDPHGGCKPGS
jgi:hypothetical protein